MKYTMRDKVYQLIGKYEAEEAFRKEKLAEEAAASIFSVSLRKTFFDANAIKVMCYQAFLADLKRLLEEDYEKEEHTNE